MNKTIAVLAVAAMPVLSQAIEDKELNAIGMIESSNNPQAVGDGTKARGEFQFHKPTWEHASIIRKAKGRPVFDYSYAHDRVVAREYAKDYLGWLSSQLEKRLGRKPELWEIYAAYNRGLEGFAKLGYEFDRLPPHTQRACSRLYSLLTLGSIKKR